jgi:hypothetical protein
MFKRASVGAFALLLLLGSACSLAVAQEKTKGKTKAGAAKVVEGELISLDVKKLSAVVKTGDGNQTIALEKDIKVLGPRDGVRRDGLEDEDLDKGATVRVTTAANAKAANEIKIVKAAPATPAAATKTGTAGKTKSGDAKTDTKTAGKTKATDPGSDTKTATAGKTKSGSGKTVAKTASDAKGPSGKIVKVDLDGSKFTIADESGKRTDFTFDADTVFLGPRGGVSDKKAKDDRFVVGAPIIVVLGVSSKAVKEVHLPYRSAIEK